MIHSIAMSRWGPAIALFLARIIPIRIAYWFGWLLARIVSLNKKSAVVRQIRANQAVVRGLAYDDPQLDDAVRKVLEMNARSLVDLFKLVVGGEAAIRKACVFDEPLRTNLETWLGQNRGTVIVGPHVLGFDAFLIYLGVKGYPIQALSYPDPRGSYVAQNAIRNKFGFNITPVSVQALRQAMKHLKRGGAVLTGVDRPDLGGETFTFFGRPVVLPNGHTRLALKTKSRILVGIPYMDEEGIYHAMQAALFDPADYKNEQDESRKIAQEILNVFEDFIRKQPERWLMFYPLWPEVIPPRIK